MTPATFGVMTPTPHRLTVALEMLALLSARTDNGELRDHISHARDGLWDWREEVEGLV